MNTEQIRNRIVSLYERNKPVKLIAQDVGLSRQSIYNHLRKAGVVRDRMVPNLDPNAARVAFVQLMTWLDITQAEAARRLDVSVAKVEAWRAGYATFPGTPDMLKALVSP